MALEESEVGIDERKSLRVKVLADMFTHATKWSHHQLLCHLAPMTFHHTLRSSSIVMGNARMHARTYSSLSAASLVISSINAAQEGNNVSKRQ